MIRSFSIVAGMAMAAGLAACAATSAPDAPPVDESLAPAPLNPLPTDLTGYLAEGDLNGAALLGPPPTPQSLTGQADRARYEETRALAGSPRWKQAVVENDLWGGVALKQYACKL